MSRIKSTETTISCRIDARQKTRFLEVLANFDKGSQEPFKYRPGIVLRCFIRAYTDKPELFNKLLEDYR